MAKQRQVAVIEEAGEGRGRRATLVQEQDFRVLTAREGLALTQVETPYLVEELKARGIHLHPKSADSPEDLHQAMEGAYELAKCEILPGRIMEGVKSELYRVAFECEGSQRGVAYQLGCCKSSVSKALTAVVKRGEQ